MQYSEKLLDHFRHPRNQGVIEDADAIGQVGNPRCGDVMKIYLKFANKNSGEVNDFIIDDIKFETLGCAAAIAMSSQLTEMVKGKSVKEALKIGKLDVAKELGDVPPTKLHCSALASDALQAAIENYKKYNS